MKAGLNYSAVALGGVSFFVAEQRDVISSSIELIILSNLGLKIAKKIKNRNTTAMNRVSSMNQDGNEFTSESLYSRLWNKYVEDINEPPVSGGMYSVLNGEWLKTPDHKNPNINDTAVVRKVQELVDQIERNIASADDPEDLKRLTDKIGTMRKSGLAQGGEFSVENLAFKTLRNMGMIRALHDAYAHQQDASMSLS